MAQVEGGLRARLIRNALYKMVLHYLGELGWFDPGRDHLPIDPQAHEISNLEEIPLNTLALSDDTLTSRSMELGSNLAEQRRVFYWDFYAEDNAIGLHMAGDIQAILEGRFGSLGRTQTTFPVYDERQATPPVLFYADIEDVKIDKSHNPSKPFFKNWYSVSFYVVDYPSSDLDM